MDLYIYYRVPASDAESFRAEVLRMQDNLARACNIVTALKRRPEEQNGMHTWMEVYLDAPDDFALRLDEAVAEHRLSNRIDGKRHTEQFVNMSLCV